jgi:hypothetical protein
LLIPLLFVIKYQCANEVAVVPQADTTQKDTVENIVVEEPKKDDNQFQGEGGDLSINLQWYSETDLDIKVTDPCGQEIRYKKRTATCNGGTGKLDVDANADSAPEYTMTPQENVFFTNPSKGDYIIKVHCY